MIFLSQGVRPWLDLEAFSVPIMVGSLKNFQGLMCGEN